MPAKLSNTRSLAIRTIGVVGIAAAATVFAPMGLASAQDEEPLPGQPIYRSSSPGTALAGPSEVRQSDMFTPQGGVGYKHGNPIGLPGSSNGAPGPSSVANPALCGAYDGYGAALGIVDMVDCGDNYQPYN